MLPKKSLKSGAIVALSFSLFLTSTIHSFAFSNSFGDVQEGHKNYIPIYSLAEDGILQGTDDGLFHPSREVNRAEAIKMILGIFADFDANEIPAPDENPFPDTSKDAWYVKYLIEAINRGMVKGYDDNTFKPGNTINLAEALKMISKAYHDYVPLEVSDNPFADVSKDEWFAEYVTFAKIRQMLYISNDNKIDPSQKLTRGYLSSILYKLRKYGTGVSFGKATYYGAAVQGHGTASGEKFDMYAYTAAHKTLPFGTIVEVMNLANGKTVQVRITDRGPFGPGREIDLTTTAFSEIEAPSSGVANIEYRVIEGATEPNQNIDIPDPYTKSL